MPTPDRKAAPSTALLIQLAAISSYANSFNMDGVPDLLETMDLLAGSENATEARTLRRIELALGRVHQALTALRSTVSAVQREALAAGHVPNRRKPKARAKAA